MKNALCVPTSAAWLMLFLAVPHVTAAVGDKVDQAWKHVQSAYDKMTSSA